jgi:hypothetical protein
MSDAKEVASVVKDIVDREMVIGPNDAEAVQKFFDHFSLKMPKELKKAMEEFKGDPNLKTQKRFVIEVNRAISGQHSIDALDEMFKPIVECARETAYELEFSDEVTEMLGDATPQESPASSEPEEPSGS